MRRNLAASLLALGVVAASCGDDGTSVFDLGVGDCFDDEDLTAEVITDVPLVSCSEPHDNEIYFEYSMTDAEDPGRQAALDAADQRCLGQFEPYVGIDFFQSDLDIFSIIPTPESWPEGDRGVLCALYASDLSKLTGSMRGAAR
jgi:hypothetical protein